MTWCELGSSQITTNCNITQLMRLLNDCKLNNIIILFSSSILHSVQYFGLDLMSSRFYSDLMELWRKQIAFYNDQITNKRRSDQIGYFRHCKMLFSISSWIKRSKLYRCFHCWPINIPWFLLTRCQGVSLWCLSGALWSHYGLKRLEALKPCSKLHGTYVLYWGIVPETASLYLVNQI